MDITLVEDDAPVAASLSALLKSYGFTCRSFASGEEFLDAPEEETACILLDARLPGVDGLEVLAALRARGVQTPVIMMTGHGQVAMAVEAFQRGAQDFIEKPFDGDDLVQRIKSAIEKTTPEIECRKRLDKLTPRETDVLLGVVAGQQNKVIAYNLGISPKTVELHRSRVMDKTGSRSVSQLIRTALRGGIDAESLR